MTSTTADVRDYLRKALAELADSDADEEQMARNIERAKTTARVSDAYINVVKTEMQGAQMFADLRRMPMSVAGVIEHKEPKA